jgi:C-terminal processing protease CtpA/Prc
VVAGSFGERGGNSGVSFAAAAFLPDGPLMQSIGPSGSRFVVSKHDQGIWTNDSEKHRWSDPLARFTGPVDVLIGPSCASACEALALAMKGKNTMLGQPTAGFTTANENVPLTEGFSVAITSGRMANLHGESPVQIAPDKSLSDQEFQQALAHGTR